MNFDAAVNKHGFDLEETVRGLNYAYAQLHPYEIEIGFENWPNNSKLATLQQVRAKVAYPEIGMLLDLGHLNLFRKEIDDSAMTVAEYIQQIPFDVLELHVHDNDGKTDQHLPPGQGNAPLPDFIRAVEKKGFSGVMTVEVFRLDLNSASGRQQLIEVMKMLLKIR
jgi:sugar phosphate isomerase/epimerase